jgi:pimeloyl-ACP methyl ester carboxylesterase
LTSAFAVIALAGSVSLVGATTSRAVAGATASAGATGWVDQAVSFRADGVTIYATFRHPSHGVNPVPGVLLIAGSGPTDRNGNSSVEPGPIDTLKTLADWLSADGVASLRYDKLGSGQTGIGPYASDPDSIGIAPFEQESAAALTFLARQKGVDDRRLGVFGHSEGALFALLLATGHAGEVPPIRALGLLEPLSLRYLSLIEVQVDAQVAAQVASKEISTKLAATVDATLVTAVNRLRVTGTVTPNLPYGLASILNAGTAKFLFQADAFDPQVLAASLARGTPVLLSCSNDDSQVSCAQVQRVVQGATSAHAVATLVRLNGVDHVLKVDPSGSGYTKSLPFSPALRDAIDHFVQESL